MGTFNKYLEYNWLAKEDGYHVRAPIYPCKNTNVTELAKLSLGPGNELLLCLQFIDRELQCSLFNYNLNSI